MNRFFSLCEISKFLICLAVCLSSCENESEPNPNPKDEKGWTQLSDLPSEGRSAGVNFHVGNSPYFGMGWATDTTYSSFWKFNLTQQQWSQIASHPSNTAGSLSFNLNGKGYVVSNYLKLYPGFQGTSDFWEYDPGANAWTQRKSYPGQISMFGTAFAINDKGYVLVGASHNWTDEKAELWEYDPVIDEWKEMAERPGGPARSFSTAFTSGGKGYIVCGSSHIGHWYNEVWAYDPANNSWTQRSNFPGNARIGAFGFSIGNKAYVGGGMTDTPALSHMTKQFWEYNPINDEWLQLEDFPGECSYMAFAVSDGKYGYVLGGANGTIHTPQFWRFNPGTE